MEVIVTMTILGFLLLVVYGVFSMGRSAWERGDLIREKYQKSRILSQLISRQIKSAVPYKIKTEKAEGNFLVFEGTAQSLKFVSALSLRTTRPEGLVYAVYEYQEGGAEGGKLVVYEQRALTKNFIEEKPKEESAISLIEGVSSVRFEYYREEDPNQNRKRRGWKSGTPKRKISFPGPCVSPLPPEKARREKRKCQLPYSRLFPPISLRKSAQARRAGSSPRRLKEQGEKEDAGGRKQEKSIIAN